jgi:hypothetical protein
MIEKSWLFFECSNLKAVGRASLTAWSGPLLTLVLDDHAAAQLHRSGHLCVARHFPTTKVCFAGHSGLSARTCE